MTKKKSEKRNLLHSLGNRLQTIKADLDKIKAENQEVADIKRASYITERKKLAVGQGVKKARDEIKKKPEIAASKKDAVSKLDELFKLDYGRADDNKRNSN